MGNLKPPAVPPAPATRISHLRSARSGIVHRAPAGHVGCLTDFNPAAFAPTTDPVTCRHCLKYPTTLGDAETSAAATGTPSPEWLRSRPHWCTLCPTTGRDPFTGHGAADHPDDRHHIGAYRCVPLHTMDYVPDGVSRTWRPREIMAALTQGYREIEPRVLLTDSTDTVELRLSLGEARQLRDHLDELLADADGDLPSTGVVQAARDVLAGARADNVRWGEVAPPPPSCEAGPLAGVALVGGAR